MIAQGVSVPSGSRLRFAVLASIYFLACPQLAAREPFALRDDDVVAFFGGANMVHLQQAGHLEAAVTKAFADAKPKFRDLAWEADTVFRQGSTIERWRRDGFGGFDEQIKRVGATVIVSQFGRLESLEGRNRIAAFTAAYERLIDRYQAHARVVVLVTPTPFEKPPLATMPDLSQRNGDLEQYVDAIKQIAAKRDLLCVDLFTTAPSGLTDNGMHIRADAQEIVAREICKQLRIAPLTPRDQLLRAAVIEKHRLWYDYWRPANWKLLYGDDSRRQFTRGGDDYVPFREEWNRLLPLIAKAEQRVWTIAGGRADPGDSRPKPEVLHGDAGANIEKELDAFTVADGLKVNLFASDKEGLNSPLAVRWDPAGRMYVAITTTYPHVFPGDVPNDKIITLEDHDHDGVADHSTVFADGLNIPTGLECGDGGVYVGQNTELLFLKDTDGDGKADVRRVVLGGLGNGDSHQTCNSFIWSPSGELYFGQGDGIESRVETPWGSADLFQAGFYRFRPRRLQLDPLLDDFMGPGNPWGVAFDEWGRIFSVDGAGGVTFLSPGQIPSNHRLRLKTIGNPGGYCGIGFLDGRHLPESLRGEFVVGDFKSNRVKRFAIERDGAGFSLQWKEPLLHSKHRNFRPVDVKQGPDGAIYVVDWYNPITCHQDDRYRDPRRDKAHGRIWRISANDTPPTRPPNLLNVSLEEIVQSLGAPEHWTRYQAKRALTAHATSEIDKAIEDWIRSLDPKDSQYEHHLYEALGAYATLEIVEPRLLVRLLHSQDARARAYAARIAGRWSDRLDDPLALLAAAVDDNDPQVRMEALIACAAIRSPRAIETAARVLDRPMDYWLEYVWTQTVHQLKPQWSLALQRGELSFARPSHLAAVLSRAGERDALASLKKIVNAAELSGASRESAIAAILAVGGEDEATEYGLNVNRFTTSNGYDANAHARVLAKLVEVVRDRGVRPAGDVDATLNQLLEQSNPNVQAQALTLAGEWNIPGAKSRVLAAAQNTKLPAGTRRAAFLALVKIAPDSAAKLLVESANESTDNGVRAAAIEALAQLDITTAARSAVSHFGEGKLNHEEMASILSALLERKAGAAELAAAIKDAKLAPDNARSLLPALFATGRSERVLLEAINTATGSVAETPEYSESYVRRLTEQAFRDGDVERGAALFKSVACVSCHKVGGSGGAVGPDLSAIGTTLSPERIIEELLWPDRQIKEGFSVVQVVTDDGRIRQGYERRTKDSLKTGDLVLQELTTQQLITIPRDSIEEQRITGSPMPVGLTSALSRRQLADLIRYLSELGKLQ